MVNKNNKITYALKRTGTLAYIASAIVFVFILFISEWLLNFQTQANKAQYLTQINREINHLSTRLQKTIDSNLLIIEALESLLQLQNHVTERSFTLLADRFTASRPSIKELQLSPNAIVKYIYPIPTSHNTIGIDLRTIPGQHEVVERSIVNGKMIMAGPLELLQGGTGLIARKPLYNYQPKTPEFWGFITVILDLDNLLGEAGLNVQTSTLEYALRGANAEGARGAYFFGNQQIFNHSFISTTIQVPGGEWELAAPTSFPHHNQPYPTMLLRIWGIIASVAFAALTFITCTLWGKIYHRSIHDRLTKLLDREQFEKIAKQTLIKAKQNNAAFSLLIIDLDLFKNVNDNFGHQAGDTVLKSTAALIQASLRESDLIGRYGGEEFIAVTPHDNRQDAQACAERIRAKLNHKVKLKEETITLSASIGVAIHSDSTDTYETLFLKADKALYQAKEQGRNCVVVSNHINEEQSK